MTAAAARKPANAPSSLEIFVARCEARAALWQAGELTLHDAVDQLQATAERDGLVNQIGQDATQAILSAAFGAVRAFNDLLRAGASGSDTISKSTREKKSCR